MAKKTTRKKSPTPKTSNAQRLSSTNERDHLTVAKLSSIKLRAEDTRELDQKHTDSLMDSIRELGLLQPIVVDQKSKLLAGGHRLAAIKQLKGKDAAAFASRFPGDLIPVRVVEVNNKSADDTLAIELAENEKRRDYTDDELRGIIERLKKSGYSMSKGGRTKKGKTHLTEALSALLGKSKRHARRVLKAMEGQRRAKMPERERLLKRVAKVAADFLDFAAEATEDDEEVESLTKLFAEINDRLSEAKAEHTDDGDDAHAAA